MINTSERAVKARFIETLKKVQRSENLIEDDLRKRKISEGFGVTRCPLDYCLGTGCAAYLVRKRRCSEGF